MDVCGDDTEEYLDIFEGMAEVCGWLEEEKAVRLLERVMTLGQEKNSPSCWCKKAVGKQFSRRLITNSWRVMIKQ